MHGFAELDGFIRQPSACGAATVHSMSRISARYGYAGETDFALVGLDAF